MTHSTEEKLLAFVAEQIRIRKKDADLEISADTVLTNVGLQSIEAVLLSGEIEDQFQVEIDPADIFEHETLGSFVQGIARRLDS